MKESSCYLLLALLVSQPITAVDHHIQDQTIVKGQVTHFYCKYKGNSPLKWRLKGVLLDNMTEDELDGIFTEESTLEQSGIRYSTITIPGKAKHNGATVQCTSEDGQYESNIATLYIIGTLPSVVNLTVSASSVAFSVLWEAPSMAVNQDIVYSVDIYNLTDEGTILIDDPECTNITMPNCTFTPDYLSPCHELIFVIVPFNGAGQGESKNISSKSSVKGSDMVCNESNVPGQDTEHTPKGEGIDWVVIVVACAAFVVLVLMVTLSILGGGYLCKKRRCRSRPGRTEEAVEMGDRIGGGGEGAENDEPFIDAVAEENYQITNTTAHPEENRDPQQVVYVSPCGKSFQRESSISTNQENKQEHKESEVIMSAQKEKDAQVVTEDTESMEASECVTQRPHRSQRSTHGFRAQNTSEGPVNVMKPSPYTPSPNAQLSIPIEDVPFCML
jgi:hypothetical protein